MGIMGETDTYMYYNIRREGTSGEKSPMQSLNI